MKGTRASRLAARQLFRLCRVNGGVDEDRVRHVALALASSERRDAIPILSAFRRLVRLDRERHTTVVESATAMPPALRDAIVASLRRLYGPRLATTYRENPGLIGGVRVRVGSDVFDGSILARLHALDDALSP